MKKYEKYTSCEALREYWNNKKCKGEIVAEKPNIEFGFFRPFDKNEHPSTSLPTFQDFEIHSTLEKLQINTEYGILWVYELCNDEKSALPSLVSSLMDYLYLIYRDHLSHHSRLRYFPFSSEYIDAHWWYLPGITWIFYHIDHHECHEFDISWDQARIRNGTPGH